MSSTGRALAHRRVLAGAAALVAIAMFLPACTADGRPEIQLDGVTIEVEIADDDAERSWGLQGHEPLRAGEGMLFVFDDDAARTFAMKDVDFPIDVVFFDDTLRVSAIEPLDPGDTRLVSSPGPSPYVLELPQGWAEEQAIDIGDVLEVEE